MTLPPKEEIPLDIRVPWLNVLRTLQAKARSQSGVAILNITIIINPDGIPKFWTTPRMTCFEPKSNADQILELLRGMIEDNPM